MNLKACYFVFFLIIGYKPVIYAQNAFIKGTVSDTLLIPISGVFIKNDINKQSTFSDSIGFYKLKVPANQSFTLILKKYGNTISYMIDPISENQELTYDIIFDEQIYLKTFTKTAEKDRDIISIITIEPKKLERFPIYGGVEQMLKAFGGVSVNNELTSGYNVRGGNFDENLVYINDFEVYRPFLVRAGQQEGLSVINPDMVDRLQFSTGGFEAKYGDKLSSVLDITYKNPKKFELTLRASFLGTDIHTQNISKNRRFSYNIGARYRTNKYIFGSLDQQGIYQPLNVDFQSFLKYRLFKNLSISYLSNISFNRFQLMPESRETSFGTFSTPIRLSIAMGGLEAMQYLVVFNGLSFNYKPTKNTEIKWLNSYYTTSEEERATTEGAYQLQELDNNLGSENFAKVKRLLGYGYFIQNVRNELEAQVWNTAIQANSFYKKSTWSYGIKFQNESIKDKINEWKYNDSAGYNNALFHKNGSSIVLDEVIKRKNKIQSNRSMAYIQNQILLNQAYNLKMTTGIRYQYWDFSNEHLISPRWQISMMPNKKFNDTIKLKRKLDYDSFLRRDWVLKFAVGVYYQPPFYREMRQLNAEINTDIKSQKSIHFILGSDINFKAWGRPFKLINELYYKKLDNLIPYYIDNIRIRYYGENSSKGYATGLDTRVNGEFIKNIESWLSFSILQTKENIVYTNQNQQIVESGYIRRPTDQRINAAVFFQDELPSDPSYKMNLALVYGSRLPYFFNGYNRYTSKPFEIPSYKRVDIGFSKEIISESNQSKKPYFKYFESLWMSVEIFNMLQMNNTVSYIWIKDISNRTYGVPNYLTGRRLNLRIIAKF